MSGTYGSNFTPLPVGTSDSGDFSTWLGRPVTVGDETLVMVQASVAIASGSNGKQLATAISSGIGSFVVTLSTGGTASNPLTCGMIPSSLTGPIASGAYFLAVRDSKQHVAQVIGATTGAIVAFEPLKVTTGALLTNVASGSLLAALTGVASTSSGLGTLFFDLAHSAGIALESLTGVAAVSGMVKYRAPFRGAD
jgi:hypothetical protein